MSVMATETTSNEADDQSVSIMDRDRRNVADTSNEVERLSRDHFIVNSQWLGGYLLTATILVSLVISTFNALFCHRGHRAHRGF